MSELERLKWKYKRLLENLPDTTPADRAIRVAYTVGYDIVSALLDKE